jgi:hypothetical protein
MLLVEQAELLDARARAKQQQSLLATAHAEILSATEKASATVSRFFMEIASPYVRHCVHGASIGATARPRRAQVGAGGTGHPGGGGAAAAAATARARGRGGGGGVRGAVADGQGRGGNAADGV